MDKKYWELLKFVLRYLLLVGGPVVIKELTNLHGEWGAFFSRELPIVLPLIDKWLHKDKDIPVRGIVPF